MELDKYKEDERLVAWNESSPNSKLHSIKEILEDNKDEKMSIYRIKSKLLRLISYHKYKEFQEKIWMNAWSCDWMLWKLTVEKLNSYLAKLRESESVIWHTQESIKENLLPDCNQPFIRWTENSRDSKLSEIKSMLGYEKQDWFNMKYIKRKLIKLIDFKKYKEFQEEIWMESWSCDWMLWKSTLKHLEYYLHWKNKDIDISAQFYWIPVYSIKSCCLLRDEKTWKLCCSRTARINWKNFWLTLPRWNAYWAWKYPWRNCLSTLPSDKKNTQPSANWPWIEETEISRIPTDANFIDFCAYSRSNFWHRAVWFRDGSWERYVLDPYIKVHWQKDIYPKRLNDYLKKRKIVKAHFYHSNGYRK